MIKSRILGLLLCLMGQAVTAFAQTPPFISEYTTLKDCKVLHKPGSPNADGPNDYYLSRCPGMEGYSVFQEGGDGRGWLVIKKGKQVLNLQGIGEGDVYLPVVAGDKLEWRYQLTPKGRHLKALVVRVGGNDREAYDRGDTQKMASFLYTVRLNPANYCILDKAKTNEEARQLADGDQKPPYCREFDSQWHH